MASGAVDQKLLKTTKFPPEFSQRVDMQKVNVEVMKKYEDACRSEQHYTDEVPDGLLARFLIYLGWRTM
jgi:hypothetical protein